MNTRRPVPSLGDGISQIDIALPFEHGRATPPGSRWDETATWILDWWVLTDIAAEEMPVNLVVQLTVSLSPIAQSPLFCIARKGGEFSFFERRVARLEAMAEHNLVPNPQKQEASFVAPGCIFEAAMFTDLAGSGRGEAEAALYSQCVLMLRCRQIREVYAPGRPYRTGGA